MKDALSFKLETELPKNSAEFRGWKNSLKTALSRYDMSSDGKVSKWVGEALTATGAAARKLRYDSGGLPRFDRIVAAEFSKARHASAANTNLNLIRNFWIM